MPLPPGVSVSSCLRAFLCSYRTVNLRAGRSDTKVYRHRPMSDASDAHPSQIEKPQSRQKVVSALVLVGEAGAFAGLTALLQSGRLMEGLELLELMIAAGLPVLLMWASARRRRARNEPLRRLEDLLPGVREGREPIESLGEIGGKLGTVAAACQEMLRDIREEKLRIAQLEEE